jgi:hypothetical protein
MSSASGEENYGLFAKTPTARTSDTDEFEDDNCQFVSCWCLVTSMESQAPRHFMHADFNMVMRPVMLGRYDI